MGLECDRHTTAFPPCWHSALPFRDRNVTDSWVQSCQCNPNSGRNAQSSLPAVVSHPTFRAVVEEKRPWETWETGCQKTHNSASCLAPFGDLSDWVSPDTGLVRMWTAWVREDEHSQTHFVSTTAQAFTAFPSLICSGGSVNMTFSICVQRRPHASSLWQDQQEF